MFRLFHTGAVQMRRKIALYVVLAVGILTQITLSPVFAIDYKGSDKAVEERQSMGPDESMKFIRSVFQREEIQKALRKQGFTKQEVENRLVTLETKLSDARKKRLANRLVETTANKKNRKNLNGTAGNKIVSETLDLLYTILTFPLKLLEWLIPGL